jgi:DNA adenine methylase
MYTNNIEKVITSSNSQYLNTVSRISEIVTQYSFWEVSTNYPHSPLRYPGGKNRAIKAICSFIPENERKLCSPFLGGGSIELACTSRMKVYGSDIFSPLIDFWQELINNQQTLSEHVEKYFPLSRDKFYDLQKKYLYLDNKIERAAAFYVLNRSSFSGTTLSGGMSPGHPRFTKSAIERLRSFHANNFEVECVDFRDAISKHEDAFLYLDPPYVNGQALYGIKGDTHRDFNHLELADILNKRERWIMSYNDCQTIRELYCDNPILSVEWVYGMSKNKQSNEVLILSKELVV